MDHLNNVTACAEWAARLASAVISAVIGLTLAAVALAAGTGGRWAIAAVLAAGALAAGLGAAYLVKRAVRRVRHGPAAPPGESL